MASVNIGVCNAVGSGVLLMELAAKAEDIVQITSLPGRA
jgi:hypothetical protein